MTTIALFGFLILVAFAAKGGSNKIGPTWFKHLTGSQKVWGLGAVILAMFIMLNPELLVLGLLGDAAFFDLLVLALSLQLRSVGFRVWHCVRVTCSTAWSFVIDEVRRELSMIVLTLVHLVSVVLAIHQAVIKSLRQHHTWA